MTSKISLKFNIFDLVLIVVTLLLAVAVFFSVGRLLGESGEKKAVYVYVDGRSLFPDGISLSDQKQTEVFVISKEIFPDFNVKGSVVLTVDKDKGISFTEADCPNHDCVRQGFVNRPGLPILCAPNGVAAVIKDQNGHTPSNQPDAVIG